MAAPLKPTTPANAAKTASLFICNSLAEWATVKSTLANETLRLIRGSSNAEKNRLAEQVLRYSSDAIRTN
jgi:hypothetical protein